MMFVRCVASTALILFISSGCKKAEQASEAAGSTAGVADGQKADKSIWRKFNAYVDCINRHSKRVGESRRYYLSWLDPKVGPTGKERNAYGPHAIFDPKPCADGVRQANAAAPKRPALEKAGSAFAEALIALDPVIEQARRYYQRQKYKEDGMAAGKAMHPKLMAAFDRFYRAEGELRGQLKSIQHEKDLRDLERFKQAHGAQSYPYLCNAALLAAQAALPEIHLVLEAVDVAKLKPLIAAHAKAADALEAYLDKQGDTKRTWRTMASYVSAHQDMVTTEKQLLRRVEKKQFLTKLDKDRIAGGHGWMVTGARPATVKAYNAIVGSMNELDRDRRYRSLLHKK